MFNQIRNLFKSPDFKKDRIIKFLDDMKIKNYKINKDYTIDVDGDVYLYNKLFCVFDHDRVSLRWLAEIPVQFNKVSGDFDCSSNSLTTLKGCPKQVNGNFHCNNNRLISLEYSPEIVGGNFYCGNNKLTTLDYAPNIRKGFWHTELTQLDGKFVMQGNEFIDESIFELDSDMVKKYLVAKEFQEKLQNELPKNNNVAETQLANAPTRIVRRLKL